MEKNLMIKKYSNQMDVAELMEVKGGKNAFNICIGKGATATVTCSVAGSGVLVPQESQKPQEQVLNII